MNKSKLTLTLIGITTFVLISGCTKKEDKEFQNYVHESIKSNVKGMDPVKSSSDLYAGIVMGQVYEGLYQYNYLKRPLQVEPLLADGMPEVSKDGKTYTIKIKKGIHFQDDPCFKSSNGKGREVTADDFIYSWKRLADPANASDGFWMFDQKIKGFTEWHDAAAKDGKADYSKPIEGLTAVDPQTLKIDLVEPYPQLIYILTMTGSYVVPHEAVDTYGPDFLNHPVGTGPYKLRSWVHNSQMIMDRNPTYHDSFYPTSGESDDQAEGRLADAGKKLPLNDGVIFYEMVEDQPRYLSFRKGDIDWLEIPKDNFDNTVKNDDVTDELKSQGVKIQKTFDGDVTFEAFNYDDPIVGGTKGKLLRQAISLSIDTQELIKKFYNGRAVMANGPVPPDVVGFDSTLKNPYKVYNIEKAKELLKKAGYPGGEGLPELVIESYGGTTSRQMCEFFQQSVAKIGIKVRINENTWPEFLEKQHKRKAQIFGMAWEADYPDAQDFLQLFYTRSSSPGPNAANYSNPAFDKLYDKAAVMQDSPARNALYHQMERIVVEDEPWVFETHRKSYVLVNGWFKNYKRDLMILNYIKYYRIDTAAKEQLKKKL